MKDEYVVNGAICLCKFGTAPGFLKVMDNQVVYMNGKLAATDKTLGKPCTPSLVKWTGVYDGVSINSSSSPLLGISKGTCILGCQDCISFQTTGQIAIPGMSQISNSALCLQADINPLGIEFP